MSEQGIPCDRCGTFTPAEGLELHLGRRLCADCRARALREVRVWSPWLILAIGTIFPPSGWWLAAADWWRLGPRMRVLLPVAAAAGRFAIIVPLRDVALSSVTRTLSTLAVNAAFAWLGMIGLRARVKAQRAAGGASASIVIALLVTTLPLFCFVTMYHLFSSGSP